MNGKNSARKYERASGEGDTMVEWCSVTDEESQTKNSLFSSSVCWKADKKDQNQLRCSSESHVPRWGHGMSLELDEGGGKGVPISVLGKRLEIWAERQTKVQGEQSRKIGAQARPLKRYKGLESFVENCFSANPLICQIRFSHWDSCVFKLVC